MANAGLVTSVSPIGDQQRRREPAPALGILAVTLTSRYVLDLPPYSGSDIVAQVCAAIDCTTYAIN